MVSQHFNSLLLSIGSRFDWHPILGSIFRKKLRGIQESSINGMELITFSLTRCLKFAELWYILGDINADKNIKEYLVFTNTLFFHYAFCRFIFFQMFLHSLWHDFEKGNSCCKIPDMILTFVCLLLGWKIHVSLNITHLEKELVLVMNGVINLQSVLLSKNCVTFL